MFESQEDKDKFDAMVSVQTINKYSNLVFNNRRDFDNFFNGELASTIKQIGITVIEFDALTIEKKYFILLYVTCCVRKIIKENGVIGEYITHNSLNTLHPIEIEDIDGVVLALGIPFLKEWCNQKENKLTRIMTAVKMCGLTTVTHGLYDYMYITLSTNGVPVFTNYNSILPQVSKNQLVIYRDKFYIVSNTVKTKYDYSDINEQENLKYIDSTVSDISFNIEYFKNDFVIKPKDLKTRFGDIGFLPYQSSNLKKEKITIYKEEISPTYNQYRECLNIVHTSIIKADSKYIKLGEYSTEDKVEISCSEKRVDVSTKSINNSLLVYVNNKAAMSAKSNLNLSLRKADGTTFYKDEELVNEYHKCYIRSRTGDMHDILSVDVMLISNIDRLRLITKLGFKGYTRWCNENMYTNFEKILRSVVSPYVYSNGSTYLNKILNLTYRLVPSGSTNVLSKHDDSVAQKRIDSLTKRAMIYYIKTGSLKQLNNLFDTDFDDIEMFMFTIDNVRCEQDDYKKQYMDLAFKKMRELVSDADWKLIKKAFSRLKKDGCTSLDFDTEIAIESVCLTVLASRGVYTKDCINYSSGEFKDYIYNSLCIGNPINIRFNSFNRVKELHDEVTKLFEYRTRGLLKLPNAFAITRFIFENYLKDKTQYKYELIDNDVRLYQEGKKQHHCVYTYKDSISNGNCYIWSMCVVGEDITIETNTSFEVRQAKKMSNNNPTHEQRVIINQDFERVKMFIGHIYFALTQKIEDLDNAPTTEKLKKLRGSITLQNTGAVYNATISQETISVIWSIIDDYVIEQNEELFKIKDKESVDFFYYEYIIDKLYTPAYRKTLCKKYETNLIKINKEKEKLEKKKLKKRSRVRLYLF